MRSRWAKAKGRSIICIGSNCFAEFVIGQICNFQRPCCCFLKTLPRPSSSWGPAAFCSRKRCCLLKTIPSPFCHPERAPEQCFPSRLYSAKRRTYVFRLLLNAPMFTFLFPSVILNGAPEQGFLHSILQREVKDPENISLPCSLREFSRCIFVDIP